MSKSPKPIPCPFCGHLPWVERTCMAHKWVVQCLSLTHFIKAYGRSRDFAIQRWNSIRAPHRRNQAAWCVQESTTRHGPWKIAIHFWRPATCETRRLAEDLRDAIREPGKHYRIRPLYVQGDRMND